MSLHVCVCNVAFREGVPNGMAFQVGVVESVSIEEWY